MFTKLLRKSFLTVPRRFFCHHQHQSAAETEELRTRILKTALIHVNKYGWSDQALAEACIDLGYPAVTSRVVANGPIDLVYYAVDRWNDQLGEDLSYLDLEEMRISDRIIQGIKIRLSYQIPYISRWNEALALGGLPNNAPTTLKKLMRIADDIWYIAGDRSTDLNWYTKRGLLIAAYSTTELQMLTDKSENFNETWNFLDRRIRDILTYGKYISMVKNYHSALNTGLSSMFSLITPEPGRYENDIDDLRYQNNIAGGSASRKNMKTETEVKIEVEIDEAGQEQLKIKRQEVQVKVDPTKVEKEIPLEEDHARKGFKNVEKTKKPHELEDGIPVEQFYDKTSFGKICVQDKLLWVGGEGSNDII